MNGFVIHGAVGRLAKDPQYVTDAQTPHCNFLLIRNDYAGKDREDTVTRLPCVAFNGIAKAIGTNARKGDQLILSLRVRNNDREEDGKTHFGYSFIVESFEFGAPGQLKRQELNERASGG